MSPLRLSEFHYNIPATGHLNIYWIRYAVTSEVLSLIHTNFPPPL